MERALAAGPVYELLVHDSPSWRKFYDSNDLAPFTVRLIPKDETKSFEDQATRFLQPFIDLLSDPIYYVDDPQPHPRINHYRSLRNVLVGLQIGCKYQCPIGTDWVFFERTKAIIEGALAQPELHNEEVEARLGALINCIKAFEPASFPGFHAESRQLGKEDLLGLLDDEMVKDASSAKWSLGLIGSPLDTRKSRVFATVQNVLAGDKASKLSRTYDSYRMLAGPDPTTLHEQIISALQLISSYISALNMKFYVPPHIDDAIFTELRGEGSLGTQSYGWVSTVYVDAPPGPRE